MKHRWFAYVVSLLVLAGVAPHAEARKPDALYFADDVRIQEGEGAGGLPFIVVLARAAPGGPVTFNFATQDGTATVADGDYEARSGSLTFPASDTAGNFGINVDVPRTGDTVREPDETMVMRVSNASGAVISDDSATATILDDDTPIFWVSDASLVEDDSGSKDAEFRVTLFHPAEGGDVSVRYSTSDATAVSPGDYAPTSGTLTFARSPFTQKGKVSQVVRVPVAGDTLDEPDEAFLLTLSDPSPDYSALPDAATGTVVDEDGSEPVFAGPRLESTCDPPRPAINDYFCFVDAVDGGVLYTRALVSSPSTDTVNVDAAVAHDATGSAAALYEYRHMLTAPASSVQYRLTFDVSSLSTGRVGDRVTEGPMRHGTGAAYSAVLGRATHTGCATCRAEQDLVVLGSKTLTAQGTWSQDPGAVVEVVVTLKNTNGSPVPPGKVVFQGGSLSVARAVVDPVTGVFHGLVAANLALSARSVKVTRRA